MEKKEITITGIKEETSEINFISSSGDGHAEIIAPSNIKFAKRGKAEATFTPEGKITFLKSLEPKQFENHSGEVQKKREWKVDNMVEVLDDVTLQDFKGVYNEFKDKINASNIFPKANGKYDVVIFYTKFEKLDGSQVNELMDTENATI